MKLGELRKILAKYPHDLDDTEIIQQFVDSNGNEDNDLLYYVGYTELKDQKAAIIFGTWQAADKLKERSPEKFPEDYKSYKESLEEYKKKYPEE